MKKVSRRALFALALAVVLAVGTLAFCVKYAANAEKWVTFSGSPHVYTGTNLTGGKIYDRSGVRILNTTDGRVYSADEAVREATIHLLGDRYGYISAPLLGNFAEQMIGYDKITGLNEASKGTASARLTISAEVQKAALQALGSYHGAVGVYNYKTGEILCAVTSPSYDPDNIPDIAGDETGAYDGVYLNRFFDAAYTPGSIFKLVTSAAALEQSASAQAGTHTCAGKTIIGGQEIICMSSHGKIQSRTGLSASTQSAGKGPSAVFTPVTRPSETAISAALRGRIRTWYARRNRSSASRTDCDRSETGKTRLPRSVLSAQP